MEKNFSNEDIDLAYTVMKMHYSKDGNNNQVAAMLDFGAEYKKMHEKDGQRQIVSISSCVPKCNHKNGWYKSVHFKFLLFKKTRRFFLCLDCEDLIPLEEVNDIWNKNKF